MKCPKCDYLGFETGDRCKNCGYDFSLLLSPQPASEPDLPLREPEPQMPATAFWGDNIDRTPEGPEVSAPVEPRPERVPHAPVAPARPRLVDSALPLFQPAANDDDAPLIKLPPTPRPPLAVRRTPDAPRLRAIPRPPRRTAVETAEPSDLVLFPDELPPVEPVEAVRSAARGCAPRTIAGEASAPVRRLVATMIDHAILLGIDALVVYFTLRLASLAIADWRLLPPVPILFFLGIVKVAYFSAFTGVGGQTIGKMAARIRVVTSDNEEVDPRRAIRRTLAGAVSVLTLGGGFLPVFTASDRRALHDRLSGTRVIAI